MGTQVAALAGHRDIKVTLPYARRDRGFGATPRQQTGFGALGMTMEMVPEMSDDSRRKLQASVVVLITHEVAMISIPKIMGVVSCGAVLCLSLSDAAQVERMKADPCVDRKTGMHEL